MRLAPELGARDFAHLRYLAATEVAAADAALGELLEGIARLTLAREAVVIVFGTRGAWLGEDGRVGLRPGLAPEVLHVPLVVQIPKRSRPEPVPGEERPRPPSYRGRSSALASTMDVAPTLYELLNLGVPDGLFGRSLMPDAGADGVNGRRTLRVVSQRAHPMAAIYAPGAAWVRSLESGDEQIEPWPLGAAPGGTDLAERAAAEAGLAVEMDEWLGPVEDASR